MPTQTTALDQAIAKRLGHAFLTGLRAAENVLRVEARKHQEAANEIEQEGSEEALLHSIECESLIALADRISQLPNPYARAILGESND